MIRFKSISEQRLECAFKCVHTVIAATEKNLSPEEQQLTPTARRNLKKGAPDEVAKTYHQYVKSFAMLVLNSGLTAALLFAQGKVNKDGNEGEAYELIIKHLTEWLKEQGCVQAIEKEAISFLYQQNSPDIRRATLEALRFLEDLKRVADARLYSEKDKKDKENG